MEKNDIYAGSTTLEKSALFKKILNLLNAIVFWEILINLPMNL
jgi:hypothetical protein